PPRAEARKSAAGGAPEAAPNAAPYAAPSPGGTARDSAGTEAGAAERRMPSGIVAGCYKPNAEVFEQLGEGLPELRDRTPGPVSIGCGEGGVGAEVRLPGGSIAVVLTPDGVSTPEPADTDSQRSEVTKARSGRVLRVIVSADSGPPPYRDRL